MKRRMIMTGLGVISPVGIRKEAFWHNLLAGVSGAITLDQLTCCSLFGHHSFGAQVVCEVKDFDPVANGVSPDDLGLDRFIHFAVAGAHQPVQDTHLERVDRSRVGVVLATAICGTQTLDKEFVKVTDMGSHPVRSMGVSPHLYDAVMGNSAAIAVASRRGSINKKLKVLYRLSSSFFK